MRYEILENKKLEIGKRVYAEMQKVSDSSTLAKMHGSFGGNATVKAITYIFKHVEEYYMLETKGAKKELVFRIDGERIKGYRSIAKALLKTLSGKNKANSDDYKILVNKINSTCTALGLKPCRTPLATLDRIEEAYRAVQQVKSIQTQKLYKE